MSATSARLRVLQAMDRIATWLPERLPLPKNDTGAALSPFLQGLRHLRRLTSAGQISAHAMRRRFRQDMLALRIGFPVRRTEDLTIPGRAGPLAARCYWPMANSALPVLLVYFHGGGFVMGDLDTHDDACRLLCEESGMPVLAVDYRLAPEHPFPAALEDADAAVRWAFANTTRFGVDAIAIGGDSAGANLAAVTAQTLAAEGTSGRGTVLHAQLLIYPSTDRSTPRPSHRLFGEGFFLNHIDRELFYRCYLGTRPQLATDPRVSPLLNPAPGRLPPALVVTAGFDMLRDEGNAYAEHLAQHGTRVEHLRFDRLGHGFINLAGVHRDSRVATVHLARHWQALCRQPLSQGE
jgi:acetyl esterase